MEEKQRGETARGDVDDLIFAGETGSVSQR